MSGENAQAIRHMMDTVGWQLTEQYIRGRIDAAKAQLMTCPIEDVPKHRATAIALQAVLVHIDGIIREGDGDA